MSGSPISLVVVTDVRLYREGLSGVLGRREDLVIVGEASNLDAAVPLVESTRPDVVVLDIASRESLATARAISRAAPGVRIVAFAVEEGDGNIFACAEAGIAAWVTCEASVDDLVATIEGVQRGELVCSARSAASMFRRLASMTAASRPIGDSPLTGREQEIVELLERGLSNKQIARHLTIEVATVKNHVHNILGKLNVARRAEVAASRRVGVPPSHPRSRLAERALEQSA